MASIQQLTGLGLVTSGFVRILAAFALFLVLARLTSRSRARHILWFLFLIGAGIYWATLIAKVIEPQPFSGAAFRSVVAAVPIAGGNMPTRIAVPFAWDRRLELVSGALVLSYAGGLFLMFFRLARRRRSLRQALAKARPVPPSIDGIFQTQCHHLRVSRCRILELPGLSSPGVAYLWNPVILMPEDLNGYLDGEQFIDVLYHELIHVRRLDYLWGTLGDIVACLLFFHPAAWLALRKLGRERELACDEAVMELRRGRRADYASCLARLARRRVLGQQLDPSSHLALLNSFLAFRVQTLLAGNHRRSRTQQGAAITIGTIALLIFSAGWYSLSIVIEVAHPPIVNASTLVAPQHSTTSPKTAARPRKLNRRPTEIGPPLSNASAAGLIPAQPESVSFAPELEGGSPDAGTFAPRYEDERSQLDRRERYVWDEGSPSPPVNVAPSLPKTVFNAAIDALGRAARGRRPDEGNDKD